MEERRLSAMSLLRGGDLSQGEIARTLGVSRQSVSRWSQALRSAGESGLSIHRPPGRPPLVSSAQWQTVFTTLKAGAEASGFSTDRWTLSRIAQVIERLFGVRYNSHYLSKRLHSLGWSVQAPAVAARERDEELVRAWLRGDWPRILKKRGVWEHESPSWTRRASRS